jgi:hypothetical protein
MILQGLARHLEELPGDARRQRPGRYDDGWRAFLEEHPELEG